MVAHMRQFIADINKKTTSVTEQVAAKLAADYKTLAAELAVAKQVSDKLTTDSKTLAAELAAAKQDAAKLDTNNKTLATKLVASKKAASAELVAFKSAAVASPAAVTMVGN
ncbi:hypothetical protein LPJ53_005804 [Coemansia erecta]|uniref:Uncharacterized protein n=1 Tax=Coemansia erecta TaxID=147472 RepID=A0A9W7XVZ6_9FUNG|nr:hypothetical protein LPJ53_005804 [Coemansia erecta]